MNDYRTVERETIIEDGAEHREALRKDYAPGIPHGDEKAGGRSPRASSARSPARSSAGPLGPSSEARSAWLRVPRRARSTRRARTTP